MMPAPRRLPQRKRATAAARADQTRLDAALVARGLVPSRAQAQAAILAGEIFVEGVRTDKAGARVSAGARIELRSRRPAFAGRGGVKLDHALRQFEISVAGLVAIDVGASTGGFTDCLLQRGASRVFAIDVGTGQLDWRLRNDPRVVSLERHDVRGITAADLGGPVDIAAVDVSFISLARVLPAVAGLVRENGIAVALVKPQFEAGPKAAPRGVVRDPAVHRRVLTAAVAGAHAAGWTVLGMTASPIAGADGNLEFFLYLKHGTAPAPDIDVDAVVVAAHAAAGSRGHVGADGAR